MNETRRDLERAAGSFEPPEDWLRQIEGRRIERQRNRRIGAMAVGVAMSAVIIAVLVKVGGPPKEGPRDAGVSPHASWKILYRDDFADPEPAGVLPQWPTLEMPSVTAGITRRRYEVFINRPFDWRYWAVAGADAMDDVRVRAAISTPSVDAGVTPGLQGVVCATSTEPVAGYVLAVDPSDGSWVIQRIGSDSPVPEPLARGNLGPLEAVVRTVVARCTLIGGETHLMVRVGARAGTAIDPEPLGAFRGPGMYLASRGGPVAASFDNLVLEVPTA